MEKKPKQVEFDRCITSIEFDTVQDTVLCIKTHYKSDEVVFSDQLSINLRTIPFQTAMAIACEYAKNVALVNYEKGK